MSEVTQEAVNIPFGGKVVVLGGDPKQILPVVQNGSKSQIINASIIKSYLWNNVKILFLTENMRLQKVNPSTPEYEELESFNNWILSIGNGTIIGETNIATDSDSTLIEIPKELLIQTSNNKIQALVDYIS